MKYIKYIAFVGALLAPFVAFAINVTVPTAPGAGYFLSSTSTGAWIATSTPYFTLGWTIGATSTGSKGINISGGCFAINNTCIGSSGSGTVTSVTLASPNSTFSISGTNPVTTSGTINADLNLSHSNWWTALQNFTNASTSQLTATSTVWFTGLNSNNTTLGVDTGGKVYGTPTTTLAVTGPITFSGTLGYQIGGANGSFGCPSCNTSSASVTSVASSNGIAGGTITTSGTLYLVSYLSTSSAETSTRVPFWTTTNGTPAQLSGGVSGFSFASANTLLTITNASTTALSATGYLQVPASSNPSLTVSGQVAVNTNTASTSLSYYDGTQADPIFATSTVSFTFINASTNGQGTTTVMRAGGVRGIKYTGGSCWSQGGTADVQMGTGAASTTLLISTTGTQAFTYFTSNNTQNYLQPEYFAIGTFSASGTTTVTCSYGKQDIY